MFQKDEFEPRQDVGFYETGRTQPPKSHSGLIAILLIAVIFLGGIFRAMDSLNISPFYGEDADRNAENCLHFSRLTDGETTASETFDQSFVPGRPCAGFTGEVLSALDQRIYLLPKGIYITQVTAGSDAEKKGISPGDILLRLDDQPITDQDSLNAVLHNHIAGDTVKAVIFRDGAQHIIHIILTEEKG